MFQTFIVYFQIIFPYFWAKDFPVHVTFFDCLKGYSKVCFLALLRIFPTDNQFFLSLIPISFLHSTPQYQLFTILLGNFYVVLRLRNDNISGNFKITITNSIIFFSRPMAGINSHKRQFILVFFERLKAVLHVFQVFALV